MQPLPDEEDVINVLQQEMGRGSKKLFDVVPVILRAVIDKDLWSSRTNKRGVPFATFEDFVVHPLWWGLESTIDDLLAYCRNAPEVQQMIRARISPVANVGAPAGNKNASKDDGNENNPDNVRIDYGNHSGYTLARLKRDRPDLAAEVVAGRMSAHAAAIAAGFRRKTWTAPDDVELLAAAIAKRYTPDEVERLVAAIA
jgi:hypothetical protein